MSKEFNRFVANSHVLFGKEAIEVTVDGLAGGASRCKDTKSPFLSVDDMDQVCEYIENGDVVFNHNDTLGFRKALNDSDDSHAFVNVKI